MTQRPRSAAKTARKPSAKQFRFGYLVHDVSRVRRTLMDKAMRPLGLTRSQWSVLSTLSRGGNDGMMQADLARLMEVGKVTVGGLVDRMEASGHVERRPDAEDRRAKRVFITEQGYEVIRLMIRVSTKVNEQILKGVSPEDQQITERVLLAVKTNIKTLLANDDVGGDASAFGSQLSELGTSDRA
jgi:MarR family transcriptional regulator for hemolysin